MKIAFHTPTLDVRGSCVAVYDYAHYNETILGHKSIIIAPNRADNDLQIINKFSQRFLLHIYNNSTEIEAEISDCDILYCIKHGKRDEIVSEKIKTVIHCVFDLSEPHGDVYVAISEHLANKFGTTVYVPHMIGLFPSVNRSNLRSSLNIPADALVFGRHGGRDTFDLQIAMAAISKAVRLLPNVYFVFVNTPVFDMHPKIHYIEKIVDMDEKNRFICTCDAMIHAQSLGETFGIAIGEFSVNNKPVITYGGSVWNDNYKIILGNRGIYYNTSEECFKRFETFDKKYYESIDNNCYKEYTPEKVMNTFAKVFINCEKSV